MTIALQDLWNRPMKDGDAEQHWKLAEQVVKEQVDALGLLTDSTDSRHHTPIEIIRQLVWDGWFQINDTGIWPTAKALVRLRERGTLRLS
jgi:hypothetical protein